MWQVWVELSVTSSFRRCYSRVRLPEYRLRYHTLEIRLSLLLVSLCWLGTAGAQTPIHKCTEADGSVVYSQLPCVTQPKPETKPDTKPESASPVVAVTPPKEVEPKTDVSSCKKRYRDAIDVIDAEIGRDYSPAKAEEYKQQLLLLTRKLRQCTPQS